MSTDSDAKIGKLYRGLYKAKCRLEKRRNDAQQMAETLRLLADCFDKSITDNDITEISNNQFKCTKTELNIRSGKSPFVDFPLDADEIATEIHNLEKEIKQLDKDLNLELRCL